MSEPKLHLGVCAHLKAEAEAAAAQEGWTDTTIFSFPAACERPWRDWTLLSGLVRERCAPGDTAGLVGADCLRLLGSAPPECPGCTVHRTSRCFEWLIGAEATDRWVREGAYLLTPGWLAHWPEQMRAWGFDPSTARQFFQDSVKRLVLLDTGVQPSSSVQLQELGAYVARPTETVPTGLEFFRLRLRHLVLEERLAREKRSSLAAAEESNRRLSGYAMMQDLICHLGEMKSEGQVIDAILDLCAMLFAPASRAYLPLHEGRPGELRQHPAASQPGQGCARLLDLKADYAWTDSEQGFRLRLGEAEEPLGILEVEGVAFAQYRRHYLSLALSLAKVCGLAIQNARAFEKIEQAVRRLTVALLERERLETQLREARQQEAVGTLAGGIGHEFNNILAATMMQLGLLELSPHWSAEARAGLADLHQLAQRAATLTRQILLFSQRSVIQLQDTDLAHLVEGLLPALRQLVGPLVEVGFASSSTAVPVKVDRRLLEQVLTDLCSNARDAMPRGGRLDLFLTQEEISAANAVHHPERSPGWYWCLAVRDTGSGMSEATRKRVFDPFFTTKEVGQGTGLGLSTAYGIVKQHHGWLEIKSRLGQGTCVRVFLPVLAQTHPTKASVASQPDAPPPPRSILVVDDDPQVRRLAETSLRPLGYSVLEARDLAEAVVQWQHHGVQIGLVITELVLREGLTGMELAQRLRAERPGLPALITCSHGLEVVQQLLPEAPDFRLLAKPLAASTLLQAVQESLAEKADGGRW